MASLPCAGCASGVVHEGNPAGVVSIVHELNTYVASPAAPNEARVVIVIIPDVFGWIFPNTRILADQYARKGNFVVYVPDFMAGDHVDEKTLVAMDGLNAPSTGLFKKTLLGPQLMMKFIPFLIRNRASVARPRIQAFFRALRESEVRPVGVAGFCWGGTHAIQMTHPQSPTIHGQRPLVDAAFAAHPVPLKVPADVEHVSVPLSFAIGTKDMALNMKNVARIQNILNGRSGPGSEHEVVVYEGAKHGFAIRGNPGDERERQAGIQAEDQAVAWFTRIFSDPAQGAMPGPSASAP